MLTVVVTNSLRLEARKLHRQVVEAKVSISRNVLGTVSPCALRNSCVSLISFLMSLCFSEVLTVVVVSSFGALKLLLLAILLLSSLLAWTSGLSSTLRALTSSLLHPTHLD